MVIPKPKSNVAFNFHFPLCSHPSFLPFLQAVTKSNNTQNIKHVMHAKCYYTRSSLHQMKTIPKPIHFILNKTYIKNIEVRRKKGCIPFLVVKYTPLTGFLLNNLLIRNSLTHFVGKS